MAAIWGAIDHSPHRTPKLPDPENADLHGGGGSRVAAGDEQENVPLVPPAQPPTLHDTPPLSIYAELKQLILLTLLATNAAKAEDPKDPKEDEKPGAAPWAQFAHQGHPPREGGPQLLFTPQRLACLRIPISKQPLRLLNPDPPESELTAGPSGTGVHAAEPKPCDELRRP
jgi:hypothetical protein